VTATNAQAAVDAASKITTVALDSRMNFVPRDHTVEALLVTADKIKLWLDRHDAAEKAAAEIAERGTIVQRVSVLEERIAPTQKGASA